MRYRVVLAVPTEDEELDMVVWQLSEPEVPAAVVAALIAVMGQRPPFEVRVYPADGGTATPCGCVERLTGSGLRVIDHCDQHKFATPEEAS